MKKYLLFAVMCMLALGFAACGDDEEEKPVIEPEEKEFKWTGDWNDPADPNYKPAGYNPIVGDWQKVDVPEMRFVYTIDFKLRRTYVSDGKWVTEELTSKYQINNTGIQYRLTQDNGYRLYEYKIVKENNEDVLMTRDYHDYNDDSKWVKWKRYKG